MHAHEHRSRLLLGEAAISTEVALYRCADRERCGAVWRILPAFLARHLWRAWLTVERHAIAGSQTVAVPEVAMPVPARTVRRWRARLASSAAMIIAALATAFDVPDLATVVERAGYAASRIELCTIFAERVLGAGAKPHGGERLGQLAALVHRLAPGVRLM